MKMHIKEFGKLTGVSVRTLHYYDEIGLLRPRHIDPDTLYRYYDERQLLTVARIAALLDGVEAERSAVSKYVLCRRFEPLEG